MQPKLLCLILPSLLTGILACGQGTFVYDQQSGDENTPTEGFDGIQASEPMGQSFTPSLDSVGFVRFKSIDGNPGDGLGATIYVNLRADSITGPILGATTPVTLPDTFSSLFTDFTFTTAVTVNPGTTYYFQPVVQSGDAWGILASVQGYAGGTAIANGVADSRNDFWFREGIVVVPEPSSLSLLMVAASIFAGVWHRRSPS